MDIRPVARAVTLRPAGEGKDDPVRRLLLSPSSPSWEPSACSRFLRRPARRRKRWPWARSNGARDERADAAEVPGQYIVTFNRVADSLRAETESRERRQGFEAEHVYKRAVEGFSAELSPGQVTRLEADPEVSA